MFPLFLPYRSRIPQPIVPQVRCRARGLTLLMLTTCLPLLATETDGQALIITPDHPPIPSAADHARPYQDSGEVLRQLPGLGGSRLGGMGIDPIIRGQGEGGVGILANGATMLAGCPNRMDPPTSYYNPSLFDAITVERGLRSLAHGLPTPGGSLRLERQALLRADGVDDISGRLGAGWNGSDDGRWFTADINAAGGPWALRTLMAANEAGDYEDGNGHHISAAHRSAQTSIVGAWQANPDWLVEGEFGISDHREVRYPGAGMDSPKSTARMANGKLTWQIGDDLLRESQLRLHYNTVDHLMDNFRLRNQTNPGMRREAPSQTSSLGAAWALELGPESIHQAGDWQLRMGVDGQEDRQEADLLNADNNSVISPMWNDVKTSNLGLYAEGLYSIADDMRLEGALRIDWWRMRRGNHPTTPTPGGQTHDQALLDAYGENGRSMREILPAAILGLQYDIHAAWNLRVAGSLAHRPATATEGFFMRRPGPMAGMWHLGNPNLKPERHQMLDVSIGGQGSGLGLEWNTSAEIFYDRVNNAIRQVKTVDNRPTRYENTDIDLMGVVWEGSLGYELHPGHQIAASADVSYTRGRNRSDGSSVARIVPATVRLALQWDGPSYGLSIEGHGAYRQHRYDPLRDAGSTPSWGIIGLNGHYDLLAGLRLRAGIDNLFDRTYAHHLSRENIFDDTDSERINEHGRSFWVAGDWRF